MNIRVLLKRILKVFAWIAKAIPVALVIVFILHVPSYDVVHQWKQPADITYDDRGPYYLSVVEMDVDWRSFPFGVDRNYVIYAGRDSGRPVYGHWVDYSFHAYSEDLKTFLSKATTEWTDQGVELVLPSDHRVFIPADMFTGGR